MSIVFLVLAVFAGLLAGFLIGRRAPQRRPERWHVVIAPTRQFVTVHDDSYYSDLRNINIASTAQVRVNRSRNESLLIATVELGADDFEEKLTDAQTRAEQKALCLNAYLGNGS